MTSRTAIKLMLAGLLSIAFAHTPANEAEAPQYPCNQVVTDLQAYLPGTLLAWQELTPNGSLEQNNFPVGARAWRIYYVSTGRNNQEHTAVCGVIIAPNKPSKIWMREVNEQRWGRIVAWAHGTVGMIPRCQPSYSPSSLIWGATPFGINMIQWGSEQHGDLHRGTAESGILAGMIQDGLIVAASDYYVDPSSRAAQHPYALGKIAAANIIDSMRAAHQLLRRAYILDYSINAYDVVTWGHSQGGHAAMFTAQLLPSYLAATAQRNEPAMLLSGVVLEAAPGMIITPAHHAVWGFSDLDWLANAQIVLTGIPDPLPIAPFIFSYLMGTWSNYSHPQKQSLFPQSLAPVFPFHSGMYDGWGDDVTPYTSLSSDSDFAHDSIRQLIGDESDHLSMPAYPDVGPLDLKAVISNAAMAEQTIDKMNQVCWSNEDGPKILEFSSPYKATPFLNPILSNGPLVDGLQHGNFDQTCAVNPPPAIAQWCDWLRYNNLGPLATNDLEKLPKRGEQLAPVYIVQGSNDAAVHCVAPAGTFNEVPAAENCQATALYESLRPIYCTENVNNGYLELNIWRPETGMTQADHSDITGLVAAASATDPSYHGSRLQRFIHAAFDSTLIHGCTAQVVNAASN